MSRAVKACTSNKRSRSDDDGWGGMGGYMHAKYQKLNNQFLDDSEDQTSIFKGVAIHVNGYTKPNSDELKRLMQKHGGKFIHFYSKSSVTHIIATSLPTSKINRLTDEKVVKPEWIPDSVEAGRLLPWQDYVLFKPKWQEQQSIKSNLTITNSSSTVGQSVRLNAAPSHDDVSTGESEIPEEACESAKDGPRNSEAPSSSRTHANPKAGDPKFLEEFYSNSRLHHISSWGAEFKAYVNQLQSQSNPNFPGRQRLAGMVREEASEEALDESFKKSSQCIMHIDMDCFFVSVGLINRPHLRGKPVAVTHSKGKGRTDTRTEDDLAYETNYWENKYGSKQQSSTLDASNVGRKPTLNSMSEIASCSYEARKAGVKNGMFFGQARQICPELIPIPYDYDGYKRVSRALYDTVASYTHDIEAVSCDEMLVDLGEVLSETGATPLQFASLLREEIFSQTKCTASAGIGPNILLARMATRAAKPNGQHWIADISSGKTFLMGRSVKELPGVGWSMTRKLSAMNIETIGDLQNVPLHVLQENFGPKHGQQLSDFSQGKDDRMLSMNKQRKSVSAEVNYGIRFTEDSEVSNFLSQLAGEVHNRLVHLNTKGKTITLKLKVRRKGAPMETAKFMGHGICDSINKSVTLPIATDDAKVIAKEVSNIIKRMQIPAEELRGIGIQMSRLEKPLTLDGGKSRKMPSILQFAVQVTEQPSTSSATTSTAQASTVEDAGKGDDLQGDESGKDTDINTERQNANVETPQHAVQKDALPPLPFLPSQISPCSSQTDSVPFELSDPQPSTSRAVFNNPPVVANEALALPSPSQIDPSCLAALPADIRREIESAFKHKKPVLPSTSKSPSDSSKSTFTLPQPTKHSSPGKSPARRGRSHATRSPRGKGKSPAGKKNVFKVPRDRGASSKSRSAAKQLQFPNETTASNTRVDEPVPSTSDEHTKQKAPEEEVQEIDLCGAVSLPDVKDLLSEWIQSSVPEEDDESRFISYMQQLALDKNLEKAYKILLFMTRLIRKQDSASWWESFARVKDEIQAIVKMEYGCPLKLPS